MSGPFVIVRDARGSLVHVRRRDDSQCFGCIEVGLFEIVRSIVLAEGAAAASGVCGGRRRTSCGVERAPAGEGEPAGGEIGESGG